MKKVMVLFLLLLVACMGFAEDKSLKVTLEIDDISKYFFSDGPFTDLSSPPTEISSSKAFAAITEFPQSQDDAPSISIWASAKTNSASPLTMQIYGTALTRTSGGSYIEEETLPLILSIDTETDDDLNSSSQMDSVEFKDACTGSTRGELTCSPLNLTENASTDNGAGTGTRPLTWKLKLAPKVTDVNIPTAGSYESYIWLVVGSNSTGA